MRMYFVHVKGKQYGPYDEARLKSMNLSPDTPAWTEGMPNWAPLSQVLPMGGSSKPMQSPQPLSQPVQQSNQQQEKTVMQQPAQPGKQPIQQTYAQSLQQPENLSLWGYYKKCWKNYATFSGRARRSEYWGFVLYNLLILLGINLLVGIVAITFGNSAEGFLAAFVGSLIFMGIASAIYNLAVIIPGLAVTSRRLHDTGRSFWWFLLILTAIIPIIGIIGPIVLLVFYFMDSETTQNRFGPNPKAAA